MSLLRYAALLLALPIHAQVSPDTIVRVQLLGRSQLTSVSIQALNTPMSVVADGRHQGTIATGETVTVASGNGTIRVTGRNVQVTATSVMLNGEGFQLRSGDVNRTYQGDLAAVLEGGRLCIVNHVRMAPYVASVVASELSFNVPEANKAQAVLARTYVARRLGAGNHYDVTDHTGSQVYRGEDTVTSVSRAAAQATAGQVLTYQGDLADAYYYSSSGGYTANNETVWNGAPVPYLRAVADPYDQGAPDHRWETSASRSAVLSALSSRFGGRVDGFEIISRTPSDRIHRVRLIGADRAEISGNQLRSAINAQLGWRMIRSTKMDIAVRGDQYVFTGAGFGHGVGMSQYGAMGQAREGRTYLQILAHYFTGTAVAGSPVQSTPALVAQATHTPVATTPTSTVRRYPTPRRIVHASTPAPTSTPAPVAEERTARRTAW